MIVKYRVSCDPSIYEAWPDVALTRSGRLVCVFSECTHHLDRSYTRIVSVESIDRGRTWSAKRAVTEGTQGLDYYYNCARVSALADGRLCLVVDRCPHGRTERTAEHSVVLLYFSDDEGRTWGQAVETPPRGMVPDKLLVLDSGRWILSAQHPQGGFLAQFLRWSDDQGRTWSEPVTVAAKHGLNLCEVSILPLGNGALVAFLRENSGQGWDCMKTISRDNGQTWGEVIPFPLPGCHRPVAGLLHDGRVLITYRFMQGGKGGLGWWTQNFLAALSDRDSALAPDRGGASTRIMPLDFDRSPHSDLGYSGWVQLADGEIYVVNYIVDDAFDSGQIRGYSLRPEDFVLPND
jgi:sialidase-1